MGTYESRTRMLDHSARESYFWGGFNARDNLNIKAISCCYGDFRGGGPAPVESNLEFFCLPPVDRGVLGS